MTTRSLRDELSTGRPLLGAWLQTPNPVSAEAAGLAGFDWVGIDTQHGLIGYDTLLHMLQAVAISGTPSVVRVSGNIPGEIGRALDFRRTGCDRAVDRDRRGGRARGQRLPLSATWHKKLGCAAARPRNSAYNPAVGDHQALCFAMVETVTGVENIDEIAAVPGMDVVYVGPSDLASSAGLPPQLKLADPKHRALVEKIAAACRSAGRWCGIHPPSADLAWYRDQGFNLLPIYRDLPAFQEGAQAAIAEARRSLQS